MEESDKESPVVTSHKGTPVADTGFVVIGAGLPRTGTLSMKSALTTLLGGPCYHMQEVFMTDGLSNMHKFWYKAVHEQATKQDWVEFLEERGYRAAVDFPPAFHYKELMEAFPQAKVILSVRSEDTWYDSCKNTIVHMVDTLRLFPYTVAITVCGLNGAMQVPHIYGYEAVPSFSTLALHDVIKAGRQEATTWFRQWNEEVKKTVPADRLLVHEAKQGWGPICDFLKLPVPDTPYPRVHDTAEQLKNLRTVKYLGYFITAAIPVLLSLFVYMVFRLF